MDAPEVVFLMGVRQKLMGEELIILGCRLQGWERKLFISVFFSMEIMHLQERMWTLMEIERIIQDHS
jgi:hypothetical protein